ncbi:hypothetical protein OUZ56_015491 [Daphnia magna]|uniref:Uncharacterized protein n=1 Tax=Daphnia magna TaxID=35525 RepID=A0ABR0AN18_9CRUS|nr:hypothetical protein OUZ56_015491 [Daphnia magna]
MSWGYVHIRCKKTTSVVSSRKHCSLMLLVVAISGCDLQLQFNISGSAKLEEWRSHRPRAVLTYENRKDLDHWQGQPEALRGQCKLYRKLGYNATHTQNYYSRFLWFPSFRQEGTTLKRQIRGIQSGQSVMHQCVTVDVDHAGGLSFGT